MFEDITSSWLDFYEVSNEILTLLEYRGRTVKSAYQLMGYTRDDQLADFGKDL